MAAEIAVALIVRHHEDHVERGLRAPGPGPGGRVVRGAGRRQHREPGEPGDLGVVGKPGWATTSVRNTCNGMGMGGRRLFPCGEGGGYAGGIVSAAMDGERCAEAAIATFKP